MTRRQRHLIVLDKTNLNYGLENIIQQPIVGFFAPPSLTPQRLLMYCIKLNVDASPMVFRVSAKSRVFYPGISMPEKGSRSQP